MKKEIIQSIKIIILGIAFSVGVAYATSIWNNPSTAPTGGNISAPINTSVNSQGVGGNAISGSILDINGQLSASSMAVFGNSGIGGTVKVNSLSGVGTRPVKVDNAGNIGL